MSEKKEALSTAEQQQKIIDEMKDALRQIGDFADGLNRLLEHVLTGMTEAKVVDLTLTKITKLADENI